MFIGKPSLSPAAQVCVASLRLAKRPRSDHIQLINTTVIYLRARSADPQDPGDNLSFQDGKIQTYNTAIRAVWQLKNKIHEEYNHIHMEIVSWSFFIFNSQGIQTLFHCPTVDNHLQNYLFTITWVVLWSVRRSHQRRNHRKHSKLTKQLGILQRNGDWQRCNFVSFADQK